MSANDPKRTFSASETSSDGTGCARDVAMAERFERHRQPWTSAEIQKLHTLAGKGMGLKGIAKALTRSEESVKDRAKVDSLKIARKR